MVVLLVEIELLFGVDGKGSHLNPKNLHWKDVFGLIKEITVVEVRVVVEVLEVVLERVVLLVVIELVFGGNCIDSQLNPKNLHWKDLNFLLSLVLIVVMMVVIGVVNAVVKVVETVLLKKFVPVLRTVDLVSQLNPWNLHWKDLNFLPDLLVEGMVEVVIIVVVKVVDVVLEIVVLE